MSVLGPHCSSGCQRPRNPRHPLESHPRPRSSQRFRPGGSSSLQGCCNHLPPTCTRTAAVLVLQPWLRYGTRHISTADICRRSRSCSETHAGTAPIGVTFRHVTSCIAPSKLQDLHIHCHHLAACYVDRLVMRASLPLRLEEVKNCEW